MNGLDDKRQSYRRRLFALLALFACVVMGFYVLFQYNREHQFKVEKLDSQLQLINLHILDAIADDDSIEYVLRRTKLPMGELRVTMIDRRTGLPTYDNMLDTLPAESYLSRPEIEEALAGGTGYEIRRRSRQLDQNYFYSAMAGDSLIVRCAVPYSISLQDVLAVDRSYLWFTLGVLVIALGLGYVAVGRVSQVVSRLEEVARRAERGESIDNLPAFPPDELGSISRHIVSLYARLQHTAAERDREHRTAMEKEHEKVMLKRTLTNNINHELKTPATSIRVCIETILNHPDMDREAMKRFLLKSRDNCERLIKLLADVSTITRLDEAPHMIDREPIDLGEIVAEISEVAALSDKSAGIEIVNRVPESLPATGNRSLVHSVFANLVANAIIHSHGSRIVLTLESRTDTTYTFSVSDNGIGIAPEHIERIFERFYRVDEGRSRANGGTGLGLAIVKNAVTHYGGTITADSTPGRGTRFTFTFPARNRVESLKLADEMEAD